MTSSRQIEEEIEQREVALDSLTARLDTKIEEFAAELPQAVEAWMKGELKRAIENNAEQVNASGVEPLRAVKADLVSLIKRLPEICKDAIGKPEDWPHRHVERDTQQRQARAREPFFHAVFRSAISSLGTLLNKHHLIQPSPGCVSTWKHLGSERFRYAINPGFDGLDLASVTQYNELMKSYTSEKRSLSTKRDELAKVRARELWKEAQN